MSGTSPKSYEFNAEDMASLIRRMADAGWLTGTNLVKPGDAFVHFSSVGHQKMLRLVQLLNPFDSIAIIGLLAFLAAVFGGVSGDASAGAEAICLGFWSAALAFYVVAQIVHIRASTEK